MSEGKPLFKDDLDGEKTPLTRESINKAASNSINLSNTKEAYDAYFKMGGTVGKMNHQTTKRFADSKKNKN
tara:strand:+ start:400 stop:612 length:213 start_codon:yes stop_codon:yes gene_type:complete